MEPRRRLLAPLATPLSSVYFHVKPSAVNHQQTVPTMRYGRYQHVLQMVSFIRYYHFRPDLKDIYCLFSIQWPVLVWPSQRIPICFKSRYMVLGGDIYCLGNFCYCDGVVIAYHSFNLSLALVQWTFYRDIWTDILNVSDNRLSLYSLP